MNIQLRSGTTTFDRVDLDGARGSRFSLTFDVDAEALWVSVSRGKERPALMSQGQYGLHDGLPRVLSMLDDLGIKATFFMPGMVAQAHPSIVPEIASAGHEIASHAYTHMPLSVFETLDAEADELQKAKDILEDQLGAAVLGFGAPACDTSVNTLEILVKQGIRYDRSFLDSDWPYLFQSSIGKLVELPVSWVLDDFAFFGHNLVPTMGWGIQDPAYVKGIWKGELEAFRDGGGFGCLVLHPEVIGRRPRMAMLRELIDELGVEFRTCADIYRELDATTLSE